MSLSKLHSVCMFLLLILVAPAQAHSSDSGATSKVTMSVVTQEISITKQDIASVALLKAPDEGFGVSVTLKPAASEKLKALTANNINRLLQFSADNTIISTVAIRDAIGKKFIITTETKEEAAKLYQSLLPLTLGANIKGEKTLRRKKISVDIISGTYAGETGEAVVTYDLSKATGKGLEKIDGESITFEFLGQTITGKPQVILENKQFKDVSWVASVNNEEGESFNFGFNEGFQRWQFNRKSETFIPQGKSYFAYLYPNTYVDGAGRLAYSDIP